MAALVFGAVAAWLMQGALLSGGHRVVGARDTETWPFLWGHWWMAHSLLAEGHFPYRTDLLDFPAGGVLWLKDPLTTLLVVPLQQLWGLPQAFTASGWLLFTLAGVGFTLLARSLGVRLWLAVAAGLGFAFSPHSLGEAYNANSEALNVAWCAWWLWALLQAIRRPAWWRVPVGALVLMALLVGNQYFGLAMAAVSAPLALWGLWGVRRSGHVRASLLALTATVLLGLLLFAPWARLLLRSMTAPDQLTLLEDAVQLGLPYVTDLRHLLRPLASLAGVDRPPPFQDIVYPGFILVAGALVAPLLACRGSARYAWPLLGLGFLVLAMGPALMVDGRLVIGSKGPIFLPWAYLVGGHPLLEKMSLPHRLAAVASLFFALGLALSAEGTARRLARRRWLALLLPLAAFAEILLYPSYDIPLHTVDARQPAWCAALADASGAGAVLDLPFKLGKNASYRYLYRQAGHQRPIAASLRHGPLPGVAGRIPWLRTLGAYQRGEVATPAPHPSLAAELREQGFAWVVLHQRALMELRGPAEVNTWRTLLAPALGEGMPMSEDTRIYALEPQSSISPPGGGA